MSGKLTACLLFAILLVNLGYISCSPAIVSNIEQLDICIDNCAQCGKELGVYFNGPLCAQTCEKSNGVPIPECDSYYSIRMFLPKPQVDNVDDVVEIDLEDTV